MKGIGFHSENERNEGTPMSRILGSGFVECKNDVYSVHKGKPVAVHLTNYSIFGIYLGTTEKEVVVLSPFILRETYPGKEVYSWERNRPNTICANFVSGMSPVRIEYLESLVKSSEEFEFGGGI